MVNLQGRNVGNQKILNILESDSKKSTAELMAMFNSDSTSISTSTMQRQLKGLRPNSWVAVRKPLISEADWGGKMATIC